MRLDTRHLLDRCFSATGVFAVALLAAALLVILVPIVGRGVGALVFKGTIEHRRMLSEEFGRGNPAAVASEWAAAAEARKPVFEMLARHEADVERLEGAARRNGRKAAKDLRAAVTALIGPEPGGRPELLARNRYGQTRWDRVQIKLKDLLYVESWDYSNAAGMGVKVQTPRVESFRGTGAEPLFAYVEEHLDAMLRPKWTLYAGFLTDASIDAHFFGGIWPELMGTVYLTIGAMLFSVPMGIGAAVYLAEYAQEGRVLSFIRTCISTLSGVPSIVFGLFGLAFFINTVRVSPSKSVLAGALSLGLLVLPTLIRSAEEALRAVPRTYKEAALSLGASRWRAMATVILPAALPGILTGIVISMGRAAGETAPIIFTAAVSVGRVLKPWETLTQPTPALSWNIYNLSTEHEAVEEIRHVQFGMVFALVAIVLILNAGAIVLRARVARKLRA
jgi:phosphate transport system permease protein